MTYIERHAAESVTGVGQISEGGINLAMAMYVITAHQNVSFTRKMRVQSPPTFSGAIRILSGERTLAPARLMMLRLEDGRNVVFSVREGDAAQGNYDIRVVQLRPKA